MAWPLSLKGWRSVIMAADRLLVIWITLCQLHACARDFRGCIYLHALVSEVSLRGQGRAPPIVLNLYVPAHHSFPDSACVLHV